MRPRAERAIVPVPPGGENGDHLIKEYAMRTAILFGLALVGGFSLPAPRASARLVENWPYEKLLQEAGLVVIAEATGSEDSGDRATLGGWKVEFLGVNTSFRVKATLKGKVEGDSIKVLHFKVKEGVLIANGPSLVSFRTERTSVETKTAQISLPAPHYLLFLKVRKDGRYEPVSGRVDPELSVREVFRPFVSELPAEKK